MVRIFCIYFDDRPIWKSDCVVPIQAGRARTGFALDMIGDDTGDNISGENLRYGEMTAWYWVWKNYLPSHPEVTHIGFSHYRRFLDFAGLSSGGDKVRLSSRRFRRIFGRHYRGDEIARQIGENDLLMRRPAPCADGDARREFALSHPANVPDWQAFEEAVRARNPGMGAVIDAALAAPFQAQELQFVMRRSVFCDFMDWAFSICRACEQRGPWHGESSGPRARVPAFLVERFFLVWVAMRRQEPTFRVCERAMVKLTQRPWWFLFVKPFLALAPAATQERVYDAYK